MKDLSRSSQSQTKGTADKAEESILHIAVSGALCGGKHRGHWAMDPGASWCLVFSWDFWTSPQSNCPIDLDVLSPGSHGSEWFQVALYFELLDDLDLQLVLQA